MKLSVAAVAVAAMMCFSMVGFAQVRSATAGVGGNAVVGPGAPAGGTVANSPIRVAAGGFPRLSRINLQETPSYTSTINMSRKGRGRVRQWALFEVTYETAPAWLDEVEFNYTVMLRRPTEKNTDEYSIFRASVKYLDVAGALNPLNANGGVHQSCVVLHPNAFTRYGDERDGATRGVVAIVLEISVDGRVMATESEVAAPYRTKIPADWWKNPQVLNSDAVKMRDGYLMDRSKSPFAMINPDDYEMVKN